MPRKNPAEHMAERKAMAAESMPMKMAPKKGKKSKKSKKY